MPHLRTNLLYIFATILVFIIVVATIWYILIYRIAQTAQVAGLNIMDELGTSSTYSGYTNTFITNIIEYFLVVALLGLGVWVYVRSQKPKGFGY